MQRHSRLETLMLAAVILGAAVLRFASLGHVPAGLYRDEAFYGLDALNVLHGQHALYFAANNGREPMFIYLLTLSIGALGRSPFAVRLPAALISLLTIPATFLMARELWGRRVGLLSAAVLAVTLWPVHLAHIGFRVGLLPLFAALTAWQAARGWRTQRTRHWVAAGILYGLSFYTYLAVRFTPALIALFLIYAWFAHPRQRSAMLQAGLPFILSTLIVVAPLAIYAAGHWDIFMGRGGQVTIFNPGIGGPNPWLTLARNVGRAIGMFFWRGDFSARQNLPYRPVFRSGDERVLPSRSHHRVRPGAARCGIRTGADLDRRHAPTDDPGRRHAALFARGRRITGGCSVSSHRVRPNFKSQIRSQVAGRRLEI